MSKFWTRAAVSLCAASIAASPAAAQLAAPSLSSGVRVTRHHDGDGRDGHHRRHRDRRGGDVFVSYWDNGEWALYNNRSWEPESYNDWWHERPERNTPRWVLTNQSCQRQYWSGGGWRC